MPQSLSGDGGEDKIHTPNRNWTLATQNTASDITGQAVFCDKY